MAIFNVFECFYVYWNEKLAGESRNHEASYCSSLVAQASLILNYPTFNTIFLRLNGLAQVVLVVLLPVIKYVINMLVVRVSVGLPFASAFGTISVRLVDALYMFK